MLVKTDALPSEKMGWDEGGGDANGATCERRRENRASRPGNSGLDLDRQIMQARQKKRLQTRCRPQGQGSMPGLSHEAVSARVEDEERDKSKTVAASNAWFRTRHLRPPCNRPVGEFPWIVSLGALGKLIVSRLSLIDKRWRGVAWPRGGETSP